MKKAAIFLVLGLFVWNLKPVDKVQAALSLPTTPCDASYQSQSDLFTDGSVEPGNIGFQYGADNNSFVRQDDTQYYFDVDLTFTPGPNTIIKYLSLDNNCNGVYGFGFGPPTDSLHQGENILSFDKLTYVVSVPGTDFHDYPRPSGIPRYIWVEVVDDYRNPTIKVVSYLVDLQNLQNPTGSVGEGNVKTPILIVPGIFGTELKNNDELLWADISRMVTGSDNFMDKLEFNSSVESDFSVVADSVITKLTFGPLNFDYSEALRESLVDQGYVEGQNLFTFPYDWRYGAEQVNIDALKGQIDYILNQTDAGRIAGKVDVVAHSTGGLIVKKYIEENPSNHHIDKLINVGVPNLGAPKAFKALINGDNFGIFGLNSAEMKKIAQNMPVAYELAPNEDYYNEIGSFLKHTDLKSINPIQLESKDLNYSEAIDEFNKFGLINNTTLQNANTLRSSEFDALDVRNFNVNQYNIIGCKTPTFGDFTEFTQQGSKPEFTFPRLTTGDGTVPLLSAQSIPTAPDQIYFVPDVDHGELLSADGSRQLISNLLSGSTLNTGGKVFSNVLVQDNPSICQISGENIQIKSPVNIDVTDQNGNHSGLLEDGSIENAIPGADFEVWDEHKYVFLPTDNGQEYNIQLKGTDFGTFTLLDEKIVDGQSVGSESFTNIPVTSELSGKLQIGSSPALLLDNNSDGSIDEELSPDTELDADQISDVTPPISTITASGDSAKEGFYRTNVSVSISAVDAENLEAGESSGVFNIYYKLDDRESIPYGSPFEISAEGEHNLSYYSVDKAGNREESQTFEFTIDKTAPEASIQFDPNKKDIVFNGLDNLSDQSNISVEDNDNQIILTDEAGNTTILNLKNRDRRSRQRAELNSISYNGITQDLSKNSLLFAWSLDKKGEIKSLVQNVYSKKKFYILGTYNGKKSNFIGLDRSGLILKRFSGLKLLNVVTNKGDLNWSIIK